MSGKHVAEVKSHKRTTGVFVPCLHYQDKDTGLQFTWTGRTMDPIEVQKFTGGEVTNIITETPHGDSLRVFFDKKNDSAAVVNAFWGLCEMWLTQITRDEKAQEPQVVGHG